MNRCPTQRELTRALSKGPTAELQRHLGRCEVCLDTWRTTTALIEAARQLPDGVPSPAHQRDAERRLLEAAKAAPSPRRDRTLPIAVAAAAVLLGLIVAFVVSRTPPPSSGFAAATPAHKGTVVADRGARYVHTCRQEGDRRDETVRLVNGTITLSVAPLTETERFRVRTDDAVVEVRGTKFSVTASEGRLKAVTVTEGKVAVTPGEGSEVLLTAGGAWRSRPAGPSAGGAPTPPTATDTQLAIPRDAGVATPPPASHHAPSKQRRNNAETGEPAFDADGYFTQGWALVKSGRYREAAALFDAAVSRIGPVPDAQDLYFWRAISHVKAGTPAAGSAVKGFLDGYPDAPRREEILAAYGWYLLERGDTEAAAANFRAALNSPSRRVKESAAAGLSRIRN